MRILPGSWHLWVLIAAVLGLIGVLCAAWWNYEPDTYNVLFMSDSTVGVGVVYVEGQRLGTLRATGWGFPVAEGTWRVASGWRTATIVTANGDTLTKRFQSGESGSCTFRRAGRVHSADSSRGHLRP